MIVEVIAVGTELLLGQIVNTNASDIGGRLAEDGFDVHNQVVVGDNLNRIVTAVKTACSRADAVVLTGGIGPTQDDMTRDALCSLLGVKVVRDTEHANRIEQRLKARGGKVTTALKMADYPAGTDPLPNRKGVALGIAASYDGTAIYAVPGVPTEMRVMIDEQVRPRLRKASGDPSVLGIRVLHCWGRGEARIAETLDELYASENPSIAFLVNASEVKVRITAKAQTTEEADKLIAKMESEVRARLGKTVFASDGRTIDEIVFERLQTQNWSIGAIEASTAGLVAARLSAAANFVGGAVVPTFESTDVTAHAEKLLDTKTSFEADVMIAVSDATGQSGTDGTAQREVAFAIRTPLGVQARTITLLGDDERLRQFAVPSALHVLRLALE